MKNFVQNGAVITVTALVAMTAGLPYKVGDLRGVATHNAAIGEPCELATEGVFDIPKTSANVITQGAKVYVLAAGEEVTTTATANFLFGIATEAAGNGVLTVPVKIIQSASIAGAVS